MALQVKDYDEAIRLLKATVAKSPKDVADIVLLAKVFYSLGSRPTRWRWRPTAWRPIRAIRG